MQRLPVLRWGIVVVMALAANGFVALARSLPEQNTDARSLRWDRFDITIDNINTSANQFHITEAYDLYIERGPYSYGFAEVPLERVTKIDGVSVSQDGVPLNRACTNAAGTYCVTQDGDTLSINYYFKRQVRSGERPQIRIEYWVYGALRSYTKGDELFWVALPEDLSGFTVEASWATVVLPPGTPVLAVTGYPDTWAYRAEGDTLIWESPPRPSEQGSFEVRVKYPHDPAMKKPAWQRTYDLKQSYIDHVQPVISLLLGALTILLTLAGVLFVVLRYLRFGRDPVAVAVPEYLTEPPGDERPGIVGLLLDEKVDMEDIMATLTDLAQREYLVIEQTEERTLGIFKDTAFTFHRTDKSPHELRPYEAALMRGLFPGNRVETKLDQLKEKFYTVIPALKQMMYNESVKAQYFKRSPETTRSYWLWGSLGLIILASILFWLSRLLTVISPLISLPPVGLGIVGAAALLVADFMPAKTEKGTQQAALWRAFRQYLKNIEHYQKDLSAEQFDRYLPYATAFGIEKEFNQAVMPTLTSVPRWYHPTYLGGPWHGGYRGRMLSGGKPMSKGIGSSGNFSPGGLESMDRSFSDGLNSISRGMSQLLNEATRVMTSTPKSSGSGRGGFSGGGRGGGSGGGSRGFG